MVMAGKKQHPKPKKPILRSIFALSGLILLGLVIAFGYFFHRVSANAVDRINRGIIKEVIFSESPVYYDDEGSVIGVFFEKTHRKYIHYDEIPSLFVKALVASEDKNFFSHPGFDILAVLRAAVANLRAGRVVQGGSTLTQQTAKNIFQRERRSFKAKLKELMQSVLLERAYSKEEILEMYANQFFVTGFGRGLEIAAHYFFDKEAKDLDLVECAFIAGSVKSPTTYNPFTKKSEPLKKRAASRAKSRKDYVLSQMLSQNFITPEQYREAIQREVPFREGKVTYRLNVILDYVREHLESDYFRSLLEEEGVENIATSGIRIFTSVNKKIQEGALRSMRYHLPLLEIGLSGYPREARQQTYEDLSGGTLIKDNEGAPFLCRITDIHSGEPDPHILVAWDQGGGIIDYDGFRAFGEAWIRGTRGPGVPFDHQRMKEFLGHFEVGDLIAAQALGPPRGAEGRAPLRITATTDLEGGVLVVKDGMVKAMVGGFSNRFFNRAVDAKRQLGSIFKPLVYAAALKLKWSILDPLVNERDLFRYQTTHYVPRPDHHPTSRRVSMAWAGAKSENLATVWLLYHLTDHLNAAEFNTLVEGLGLSRGKGESYEDYVRRIRDGHGVLVTRNSLIEAAFEEAKNDIRTDLIFAGLEDVLPTLLRIHLDVDRTHLDLRSPEEYQIHRLSFRRLGRLDVQMKQDLNTLRQRLDAYRFQRDPEHLEYIYKLLSSFYLIKRNKSNFSIAYGPDAGSGDDPQGLPLTLGWLEENIATLNEKTVLIDGILPSQTIRDLNALLKERLESLMANRRYDPQVLYRTPDFKTLIHLTYVCELGRALGIATPLEPVLSFPLGANAVSIADAAHAYYTLMTGESYSLPLGPGVGTVPIIKRIEDRDGVVIWEHRPRPEKILSDGVSQSISEILRAVMEHGTGRRARDAVRLHIPIGEGKSASALIPSFGKTGTANRFTSSSFVGYVPGPNPIGDLELKEGYVVACYVGYDDNRPMKGEHVTIYGASGALPIWTDTVEEIVNNRSYAERLHLADIAFDNPSPPYTSAAAVKEVQVSRKTGLPLARDAMGRGQDSTVLLTRTQRDGDSARRPIRVFEPFTGGVNVLID